MSLSTQRSSGSGVAEKNVQIPFHRPSLSEEEVAAVSEVVRSGWLTTGPKCIEFEKKFSESVGVKHAIAVSSCTAALHLGLEASGVREGDEVLVPALTFAATAEVVSYFRAKPVLVDSEPSFFNMDARDAEKKISPRTRAIIPVHFAGLSCDMDAITSLARTHGLQVIEDAAHAFPAKYRDRPVGTISPITAFSFYATKTITTGEGGMAVTNDDTLASRMRIMRLHGMSKDGWKRYTAEGNWRYEILEAGFKYNLTDLQAAIGLVQLGKAEFLRARREAVATHYSRRLSSLDSVTLPKTHSLHTHAWHLYVVLLHTDLLRIDRDKMIEELRGRGIGIAVHFIPLHYHPYYQRRWKYQIGQFPVAEHYFERCISLPLYPDLTEEEVDYVADQLTDILQKYRR
jgi:dTDP-4-amino-4,6-dideoxygalactose transaminase